jgi:translation elongation factor P/translation initiation factor 5A
LLKFVQKNEKNERASNLKEKYNQLLEERGSMYKFMQIEKFTKVIFDSEKAVQKARKIMESMLQANSFRINDVADQMAGNESANYKLVQRSLAAQE